jgi:hypothetical protein
MSYSGGISLADAMVSSVLSRALEGKRSALLPSTAQASSTQPSIAHIDSSTALSHNLKESQGGECSLLYECVQN